MTGKSLPTYYRTSSATGRDRKGLCSNWASSARLFPAVSYLRLRRGESGGERQVRPTGARAGRLSSAAPAVPSPDLPRLGGSAGPGLTLPGGPGPEITRESLRVGLGGRLRSLRDDCGGGVAAVWRRRSQYGHSPTRQGRCV